MIKSADMVVVMFATPICGVGRRSAEKPSDDADDDDLSVNQTGEIV